MTEATRRGEPLNVAFISQWYQPEPVTQPGWIVDGIEARGARVQVMTGIPNYPSGQTAAGYRAWRLSSEIVDGVKVHRYPLFTSHDRSAVRRMANYLSWAVSSAFLGQRMLKRADVALVYSSPATAALPAFVARKLRGLPYILVIQDVWPDSVFASGFLSGRSARLVAWLLDKAVGTFYANAAKVVVISPGALDLLESRGVPRDKLALVYNWVPETAPPESDAATPVRHLLGLDPADFVVMYSGNHGVAQALDNVVEAFGLLPAHIRAHLVLVGDGIEKPRLRGLCQRVAPGRVHFVAPVPRDEMVRVMGEGDVHLVSLADDPLFAVTMPSKLQSILAAGLPALVCAAGDAARIVEEAGAGLTARPADPADLASVVTRLAELPSSQLRVMGARGRRYYGDHMSADVGSQLLLDHLIDAVQA